MYDSAIALYVVDIPDFVRREAKAARFDLEYFEGIAGPVPESRLPKYRDSWPNPKYLEEFNRIMFG